MFQCEVVFNNDRNMTYSCVYVPTMEGEYRVCTMLCHSPMLPLLKSLGCFYFRCVLSSQWKVVTMN